MSITISVPLLFIYLTDYIDYPIKSGMSITISDMVILLYSRTYS